MSTVTLDPEIVRFASAVRRELADLAPEEVDDLTDGLEADLAERSEESGAADFGDPAAYAAELRAAAGLPPRGAVRPPRRSVAEELRDFPQQVSTWWTGIRRQHSSAEHASTFLVAIRPVWWLLRGWALYLLLVTVFGVAFGLSYSGYPGGPFRITPVNVVVLGVCVVLSVQWGRGRWMPGRGSRAVVLAGSVLAAVAMPFLLGWAVTASNSAASYAEVAMYQSTPATDGLRQNGRQITNVFAYDADGQPVSVRLYDEDGHQLRVNNTPEETYWQSEDGTAFVPATDSPRGSGWNVFPLQRVREQDVETGTLAKHATRHDADAPYVSVPPLLAAPTTSTAATPDAVPTPGPVPTGDAATSDPSAMPTPTPTPGG